MQAKSQGKDVFKNWWEIWTSKIIVSQAELLNTTEQQKQQNVNEELQMKSKPLDRDPVKKLPIENGRGS